jgi:tetratricopeptide (TPR) repeat protein
MFLNHLKSLLLKTGAVSAALLFSACPQKPEVTVQPECQDTSSVKTQLPSPMAGQLKQQLENLKPVWASHSKFQEELPLFEQGIAGLRLAEENGQSAQALLMNQWIGQRINHFAATHPDSLAQGAANIPWQGNSDLQAVEMTPQGSDCEQDSFAPFDYRALYKCVENAIQEGQLDRAKSLLERHIDPHNNLLTLSKNTIQLAELYQNTGDTKKAVTVLEGFLVFKPAIKEWLDSAEALESRLFTALDLEHAGKEAQVAKLKNLIAVKAPYQQIKPIIENLRSSSSQDPMISSWVDSTEAELLRHEKSGAETMIAEIRTRTMQHADFPEARKLISRLQQRYPHLAQDLHTDTLAPFVERMEKEFTEHKLSSSGEDPKKVLADARALTQSHKLLQARAKYMELLSTELRPQALEEIQKLGVSYCEENRRKAADSFARSRVSSTSKEKKVQFLESALNHLNLCLENFPEVPIRSKVEKNKMVLQQELNKIQP